MAVSTGWLGIRRNKSSSGLAMWTLIIGPDGRPMLSGDCMNKDRIIEAVKGGMSYGEVAERFGMTRNQVAGIMHRAGVKVGPRPEKVKKAMKRFMASPEGEKFRRDVAERNRLRWARTPKRERIAHSRMMREARSTT